MKIIIETRNIQITEVLEDFIEEKMAKLERFLKDIEKRDSEKGKDLSEIRVIVGRNSKHHKKGAIFSAECNLFFPPKTINAIEDADNMSSAIIKVRDEILRQIKNRKKKMIDLRRKPRKYKI
ncbi:MAG: ribosome-associated translation inhibitor RaiA [Candidatus Parcubacteria bacterium]|nr:ribosome-associated translation inhibitor RaiA [Candidatus Parcubacteria bacterium]